MENGRRLSPWIWVPTLYFAEGIPNSIVSDASKVMYTDFGLSLEMLGVVTGLMYWAWVVKPLWSPLVDLVKSKRWWIVLTEILLAASFLGLSAAIKSPNWMLWTQVCFWSLAVISATQDIAADGYYMLALDESNQAGYTGIRSTAYRLSMLFSKGVLVWLAGYFAASSEKFAGWSTMFMASINVPAVLHSMRDRRDAGAIESLHSRDSLIAYHHGKLRAASSGCRSALTVQLQTALTPCGLQPSNVL